MEKREDPLSLWVGSWTPEEVAERDKRRRPVQEPASDESDDRDPR